MSMAGDPLCAICSQPITPDRRTAEHIIPNAIGGRRKVRDFICLSCNSETGTKWDSALASQLNFFNVFFGISRGRGQVQSQKVPLESGHEIVLNPDGTLSIPDPVFSKIEKEEGVEVNIKARDLSELRRMVEGLAKKYSEMDVKSALDKATSESFYVNEPIHMSLSLGGLDAGRSMVKSALALLCDAGVHPHQCEHAIEFLTGEEREPCFGYFYERDLITNRPEGMPLHCVHVQGDSVSECIRAYIEYFGVFRAVMCLSSQYSGEGFDATYGINPVTGDAIDLAVGLDLSETEIREAYAYQKWGSEKVREAFGAVIGPQIEAQREHEKNRVVSEAVEYAFANCGAQEGEELTEDQRKRLIGLLLEKLEPWLVNQIVRR